MSLFTNRPQTSASIPFYSLSLSSSILLVGLGNIGEEYDLTRHNIGFYAVDAFVAKQAGFSNWALKKDLKCWQTSGKIGDNQVIVIKPTTMMNLSGEAVKAVSHYYKIPAAKIVVLHDELDIDFGHIRLRHGGTSAGHNGIKSVSALIGEDYGRVRIGIGPKKPSQIETADYVLQKFPKPQQAQLKNLSQETTAILSEYCYSTQLQTETRSFIV
jgi:PTH1 family peptidyl-tRNA hydrolase